MGFCNRNTGNVHTCWIQDGYVYEETACTHAVYKYATRLPINLPKQLNLFVSQTVAFLLYDDEKMYIGRLDGVISIYRRKDNLLVGLNNWDAPGYPPIKTVGFYRAPTGIQEVKLDTRDKRTVYIPWKNTEASLERAFLLEFSELFSVTDYCQDNELDSWHIYDERGDKIGIDVWYIQDDVWRRNCPVFL